MLSVQTGALFSFYWELAILEICSRTYCQYEDILYIWKGIFEETGLDTVDTRPCDSEKQWPVLWGLSYNHRRNHKIAQQPQKSCPNISLTPPPCYMHLGDYEHSALVWDTRGLPEIVVMCHMSVTSGPKRLASRTGTESTLKRNTLWHKSC